LNGLRLIAQYATGKRWEVVLDSRLLLDAARRGTDDEVTLEVAGPFKPVLISCGYLTALIAQRVEEPVL
jgi:hypothetical protein